MKKLVILMFGVALILAGCEGGDGGGGDSTNLVSMDLSGAKALMIASKDTQGGLRASAAVNEPEVLYKLTDEGLLVEVTYFDDSGNPIGSETYQPEYLEDLNKNYVYIRFSGGPWPPHYIVRKSTGEVFQMQHEPRQYDDGMNRRNTFQSEAHGTAMDGNAYYRVWDNSTRTNSLRRIELGSSGNIVDRRVSPEGDNPGQHDGSTFIAADGTIFYSSDDDDYRVISSDGRVLDPTQEIISGQPEFTSSLLQGGPSYGETFIGTDGAIYFQNNFFPERVCWYEEYFVPKGPDGDTPPDPGGPPILVYDATGSSAPIQPYNPETGALLNLRNPISVCSCSWDRNCSEFPFTIPENWDWFPRPFENSFEGEEFADQVGNIAVRYDEFGNRYTSREYDFELVSFVWRLSASQDGGLRLVPYGGMATNHRWLPAKAPDGFLFYDPMTIQQRYKWGGAGFFLRTEKKVIGVDVSDGGIYELNNPAGRPIFVDAASHLLTQLIDIESTDTHYYLLGRAVDDAQISLYRFDAETHTPTELIDGSEYELYKFTVTKDDEVVFRGARRSDGADIGGTINLAGEITVIEAIQNRNIVQLVRVL